MEILEFFFFCCGWAWNAQVLHVSFNIYLKKLKIDPTSNSKISITPHHPFAEQFIIIIHFELIYKKNFIVNFNFWWYVPFLVSPVATSARYL